MLSSLLKRLSRIHAFLAKRSEAFAARIRENGHQKKIRRTAKITPFVSALALGLLAFGNSWGWWWPQILWVSVVVSALASLWAFWVEGGLDTLAEKSDTELSQLRTTSDSELGRLRTKITTLERKLKTAKDNETAAETRILEFRDGLKGVLLPLATKLEEIPLAKTHGEASAAAGGFQGLALDLLVHTAGDDAARTRATLYERKASGPTLIDSRGRAEPPRETFKGKSLEKINQLMDRGDARVFYTDDPENAVTPGPNSTYKVVVASSVGRKQPSHGMLTIDCPEKDQLGKDDKAMVQSIGSMLAAAQRIVALVAEVERSRKLGPDNA